MAESSDLPCEYRYLHSQVLSSLAIVSIVEIRTLQTLTTGLSEICHEIRYRQKDVPAEDSIDYQQVSDQLTALGDVLGKLFNAAMANDSQSLGIDISADVNGHLARCREKLNEMEGVLKRDSGRKKIKGPASSGSPIVLIDLAPNIAALRESIVVFHR